MSASGVSGGDACCSTEAGLDPKPAPLRIGRSRSICPSTNSLSPSTSTIPDGASILILFVVMLHLIWSEHLRTSYHKVPSIARSIGTGPVWADLLDIGAVYGAQRTSRLLDCNSPASHISPCPAPHGHHPPPAPLARHVGRLVVGLVLFSVGSRRRQPALDHGGAVVPELDGPRRRA